MMKKTASIVLTACLALLTIATSVDATRQNAAASSPKADALKLYTIIKNEDWKALFFIVKFSAKVQADMPDDPDVFAKSLAEGIRDSDPEGVTDKLFKSISDITIGEPVVNGNNAEVPTAANLTINGKIFHFKGSAHLVQDKNAWKWDLTFTDDAQQATSQGIQMLIGKPDPQ